MTRGNQARRDLRGSIKLTHMRDVVSKAKKRQKKDDQLVVGGPGGSGGLNRRHPQLTLPAPPPPFFKWNDLTQLRREKVRKWNRK